MPAHRLLSRFEHNIHFVNSENDELGGAYQTGSLTWTEMSRRMDIVFELPPTEFSPFPCLEDGDPKDPLGYHGPHINLQEPNNDIIKPGFYILLGLDGKPINIPVNQEMPLPRAISRSLSGSYSPLWQAKGWKQRIIDDDIKMSDTGINSIQNGILLDASTNKLFNKYIIAINPDDDYKVVCFVKGLKYEGLTMFRRPDIPDKHQPCHELLKHHFRMAVLLNTKGRVGYPVWDEDIPEGCDQVAEISESDQGKLRFETILAEKLNQFLA